MEDGDRISSWLLGLQKKKTNRKAERPIRVPEWHNVEIVEASLARDDDETQRTKLGQRV